MKRPIIFTLILASTLSVGCSMNNQNPKSPDIIQQATVNMNKLMNASFNDVENYFGSPDSAVYYINTNNLKNKDINNLTMEDLRDNIEVLSTYVNSQNPDSYLYVYYENGKVKDTLSGAVDLLTSQNIANTKKTSQANYKVEFFKNKGSIDYDNFNLNYAKNNFIGKDIDSFNKAYKVSSANFIGSNIKGTDKIYFYPLVTHNTNPSKNQTHPNYTSNSNAKLDTVNPLNNNISITNKTDNTNISQYSKSSVLVYTKDNIIQTIEIVDGNFIYGLIDKSFNTK